MEFADRIEALHDQPKHLWEQVRNRAAAVAAALVAAALVAAMQQQQQQK